jgi:hypothetical protein
MFSFRCGTAHKSFLKMQHIIYQNPEKTPQPPLEGKTKRMCAFCKDATTTQSHLSYGIFHLVANNGKQHKEGLQQNDSRS